MSRILLGVTGSVAAVRTPELFRNLRWPGMTSASSPPNRLSTSSTPTDLGPTEAEGGPLYRDADEWPGDRYRRGDPVLHIELRQWADLLVVAPLDAHSLARFALGLSDNLLTCLFRAWDFARPVVLAPAMNTLMWESPVTRRHLRQLLDDRGDGLHDDAWPLDRAAEVFARHAPGLILVPPQSKRLACGDVGVGAMAEVVAIAEAVRGWGREPGTDLRLRRSATESLRRHSRRDPPRERIPGSPLRLTRAARREEGRSGHRSHLASEGRQKSEPIRSIQPARSARARRSSGARLSTRSRASS